MELGDQGPAGMPRASPRVMYHVTLKMDGKWQEVARGFTTFDGATAWAHDVLEAGKPLKVTGYRVETANGLVCCSVETGQ